MSTTTLTRPQANKPRMSDSQAKAVAYFGRMESDAHHRYDDAVTNAERADWFNVGSYAQSMAALAVESPIFASKIEPFLKMNVPDEHLPFAFPTWIEAHQSAFTTELRARINPPAPMPPPIVSPPHASKSIAEIVADVLARGEEAPDVPAGPLTAKALAEQEWDCGNIDQDRWASKEIFIRVRSRELADASARQAALIAPVDPQAAAKAEWDGMNAEQKSAWIGEDIFVRVRSRELSMN